MEQRRELTSREVVFVAASPEEPNMKFATIAVAAAAFFANSMALAQNASTGSTTTTGDAAVSPATSNAANAGSGSGNYPSPGAGIASGAMNNGTTGDTIGTGH